MRLQLVVTAFTLACLACSHAESPAAPPVAGLTTPVPPTPLPDFSTSGSLIDPTWRPVANAIVEQVIDSTVLASTSTDAAGTFSILGKLLTGSFYRARKEGYQDSDRFPQSLLLGAGGLAGVGLLIAPLNPVVVTPGDYDVRFDIAPPCAPFDPAQPNIPANVVIPESLRSRTYRATLSCGANSCFALFNQPNVLSGFGIGIGIAGHRLATLPDWGVSELLPDLTFLDFSGDADATLDTPAPSSFTLTFQSYVAYCRLKAPPTASHVNHEANCSDNPDELYAERLLCSSTSHRIVFTRR